ncbi:peptidylprolyl isomerase [Gudongella sp. SC589]|jgi:peptidyl-prolyl cis-trans isomerase B (cyclophilin B)|uniref:peptidylprolyl isomerase n=1 Tax=Gudongella sp. SC589 TaxID=3385990 RepID=UPI0039047B68
MLEQLKKPENNEEIAIIKTNHGDIKLRLFPQVAPKAVENFTTHARDGYYDGISFHRIIKDFMIQGGDPDGTGRGGQSIWGRPFEDEFSMEFRNIRGALSMANAGPKTNGSQFFIVQKSDMEKSIIDQMKQLGEAKGFPEDVIEAYQEQGGTYWLDGKHTVFGQVFDGMDVVDKIAKLPVGRNDMPKEPVMILTIEITEYKGK